MKVIAEQIYSVGIDIGTSTTQVIFSILTLKNEAGVTMVPRIKIVDTQVVFQSALHFTPLLSTAEIDAVAVRDIVQAEYEKAGMRPEDIATGAVIITGETARKRNADTVLRALSDFAGKFVVATAGPDLESVLSGRGSGADYFSREKGRTVVNVDIGGGTSNFSVFENGKAVGTACYDIGGRLIRFDKKGRITYIAPKMKKLAATLGMTLETGAQLSDEAARRVAKRMAGILEEAAGLKGKTALSDEMVTNHGLPAVDLSDAVFTFSGGVADCIYFPDRFSHRQFEDIGVDLGQAMRETSFFTENRVIRPLETIRATVVGAGNHAMELSGSTITYTEADFPIMDVPVIKVKLLAEKDIAGMPEQLRTQLSILRSGNDISDFAVAFKGIRCPDYDQVEKIADAVCESLAPEIDAGRRIIVIVEEDFGKALGLALKRRIRGRCRLICVDGVHIDEDGAYVDIGKPVAGGKVLPVVVKTLVFT